MKQISNGGKRPMKIFLFISFIVGLSACKKEQNNTEDLGRTILFVSNRDGNDEIYAMNIDSTNLIRLTNNAVPDGRATWSADGQFIAYASGNAGTRDIYIMDANGQNVRNLTNTPAADEDWPDSSPT